MGMMIKALKQQIMHLLMIVLVGIRLVVLFLGIGIVQKIIMAVVVNGDVDRRFLRQLIRARKVVQGEIMTSVIHILLQ